MWKWLRELVQAPAEKAEKTAPPPDVSSGLLDALWQQALPPEEAREYNYGRVMLRDHAAGQEMLALDGLSQASLVVEALRRQMDLTLGAKRGYHINNQMAALPKVAAQLLRRNPDFQEEHLVALAETAVRARQRIGDLPLPGLLRAFENHVRKQGLGAAVRGALTSLVQALEAASPYKEVTQTLEGLRRLLRNELPPEPGLRRGDAWADDLLDALGNLPSEEEAAWQDLLAHCATATASKPSSKWLARAKELASGLDLATILASSLGRIGEPGIPRVHNFMGHQYERDRTLLDDTQTDLLRGLVWCAGLVDHPALAAALGSAAEACFRKIANHGPRNAKVGNACLETLSRLDNPSAVAQLSRLRTRVRHPSSRRQLETALDKAADRQGLTKGELEEMSVPTQGLTEVGLRREALGDFTAELQVTGTAAIELVWLKQGKRQKSVPKTVKESHAEELKALIAAAREIQKLLPGQRDRLERLYLFPRDWDLATWREHYLDHPLVGTLARRLIWRLAQKEGNQAGFWREGRIVDAEGQPLDFSEDVRVTLWHPLDSPADEVLAWRTCLEAWEVVQPFKQAHREIYLLTEAEQQTATYSNRFAAHILKQHQLAALCKQRGWTYSLQGEFDSHDTPTLEIPEHGLRVELWVEAGTGEISEAGIYLHVATDQVRFSGLAGAPRLLEQIPPLLFSELMRDVDLFVGVCSVGNDPNWVDGGDRPGMGYWHNYSFGELGESARTRRELLGRLVPRLKIADRCTLAERFLVVRGDRRTYKIHLGSGNILMEPNDQYLCIVADRSSRAEQPVLPFEGDGTLAVILSKAFLLAEDTKIADPQIVGQLGR
ncbi:MAG TPA: DUF4132 domain-containing protein [Thermoanaerobaculia bacterium]|nr:DUF4132 domain-containing protein [Thermoanaerobaculia bacterium]